MLMLLFPVPEKGQLQPQCPTISTRVRIKHSSVGKQLCPFARLPVRKNPMASFRSPGSWPIPPWEKGPRGNNPRAKLPVHLEAHKTGKPRPDPRCFPGETSHRPTPQQLGKITASQAAGSSAS